MIDFREGGNNPKLSASCHRFNACSRRVREIRYYGDGSPESVGIDGLTPRDQPTSMVGGYPGGARDDHPMRRHRDFSLGRARFDPYFSLVANRHHAEQYRQ